MRALSRPHVIFCAAENAALPGGKVGGVGDVIAALPPAVGRAGWRGTVLMPGYGTLSSLPAAKPAGKLRVAFGGASLTIDLFAVDGEDGTRTILFEHAEFCPQGPGRVYCDDGDGRPFATDAGKFALFSAACAAWVAGQEAAPRVVHLHDWHAALYCVLRAFDPRYAALRGIRTVFTIHNLAMQGIRPLDGDASSLAAWFPGLRYDLPAVVDPRYADCINPMAAAIRLADAVNTVSPTYATEILLPNDGSRGFHGGEGLEADLQQVRDRGRLFGILNGCEYPKQDPRRPGWRRLLDTIGTELDLWRRRDLVRADLIDVAAARLGLLPKRRPRHLLTCIGRLTEQKAALFITEGPDGRPALDGILDDLSGDGILIVLGSGDPAYERRFAEACRRHANLLFLPGYSDLFPDLLYRSGDLFLMPSSFEPCGISQLIAMRAGQPCVVHAVGGLRDTVIDGVTGFSFDGPEPAAQAGNFRAAVRRALEFRRTDENGWLKIREAARAARFTWDTSATAYIGNLYD